MAEVVKNERVFLPFQITTRRPCIRLSSRMARATSRPSVPSVALRRHGAPAFTFAPPRLGGPATVIAISDDDSAAADMSCTPRGRPRVVAAPLPPPEPCGKCIIRGLLLLL